METKVNSAGEQQPMKENGQYTFKNFKSPHTSNQLKGLSKQNFLGKETWFHKNGSISKENNVFYAEKMFEYGKGKKFNSLEEAYRYLTNEEPQIPQDNTTNVKEKNKKILEDAGLNSHERKYIYKSIDDYFLNEHPIYDGSKVDADIDIGGFTVYVSKAHIGEDGNLNYEISNVETYKRVMINLLKEKGIDFDLSKISDSIYFEYKGETYRISDHKRPMQDGFYDPTSTITHNIVVKDNKERFEKLKKILEE